MSELSPDLREQFNRAEEAARIMAQPMVVDALAAIEQGIFDAWADPHLTLEQREELNRLIQAHRRFVSVFETHLKDGELARHELGLPVEQQSFFQRIKQRIKERRHGKK